MFLFSCLTGTIEIRADGSVPDVKLEKRIRILEKHFLQRFSKIITVSINTRFNSSHHRLMDKVKGGSEVKNYGRYNYSRLLESHMENIQWNSQLICSQID